MSIKEDKGGNKMKSYLAKLNFYSIINKKLKSLEDSNGREPVATTDKNITNEVFRVIF